MVRVANAVRCVDAALDLALTATVPTAVAAALLPTATCAARMYYLFLALATAHKNLGRHGVARPGGRQRQHYAPHRRGQSGRRLHH